MRLLPLLFLFYIWGNCSTERVRHLQKVTQYSMVDDHCTASEYCKCPDICNLHVTHILSWVWPRRWCQKTEDNFSLSLSPVLVAIIIIMLNSWGGTHSDTNLVSSPYFLVMTSFASGTLSLSLETSYWARSSSCLEGFVSFLKSFNKCNKMLNHLNYQPEFYLLLSTRNIN